MFKHLFRPKPEDFAAPFEGKLMNLPVSGTIVAVFPTGHAIGIKADDRNEYLIHLGLDTVNYKGEGFTVHAEQNQRVAQGDLLVDVDLEFFLRNNVSMVCPILVVNANSRKIRLLKEGVVALQEKEFLAITA